MHRCAPPRAPPKGNGKLVVIDILNAGHTDYRARTKRLSLLSVSTRITVGSSSYSFAISSSQSCSGSSVWG
ncbi:hypothetical protein MTR67_028385, partial [Solanum verrucosum]